MKTKISNGNRKVGSIPNISLTPGKTCSACACKTCLKEGCYAMKSYRMYKNVRAAWDSNTDLAMRELDTMERELNEYFAGMNAPRFFRVHVAGDFFSREYAKMWARVARRAGHTNFLAFTKQWDNVRGVDFPENFSIVLSGWPGTEIPKDLAAVYPIAECVETENDIPSGYIHCPGNCETCGMCWQLKKIGRNVAFVKH